MKLWYVVISAALVMGGFAASSIADVGSNGPKADQAAATRPPTANRPLFAVMRGKNEVNAVGKKRVGDPDGRGSFSAIVHDGRTICFGITVTGVATPTAAHIHKGRRSKNGPIVVTLSAPSGGNPGASSGCVDGDSALLSDIRKRSRRYYVNVHTGDFPDGALRGQLFHPTGKQDR